ncbi:MAG TPA: DbpA RNA binding domain-containing protein [Longimicrobiales bacterium]|nr:DbpA RNA binding domain-containing protein [Longimicrobiales bacterium]
MAATFEDLGIAPELCAGAHDMGWETPAGLQRDAVPVLRRGNNGILHASTGAGVTGAWGLAVLDRLASLEDDATPAVLVLAPSTDEVSRTAATLARLAAPAGLTVRALAAGWTDRPAQLLVATPAAALGAVRDSALKLDSVAILVVGGADRIHELGGWGAVRTLTDSVTGVGQKIIITGELGRPVPEYVEGHVRKALTIPPRPAEEPETTGEVGYAVASESEKPAALVALASGAPGGEVAVICRTRGRATRLGEELAGRGVALEGAAAAGGEQEGAGERRLLVLSAAEADRRSTRATVISADVPFDAEMLADLHRSGGSVLVTPAELPHLRRIAARARFRLRSQVLPRPGADDAAETARNALRVALREADLAAYLSLIEPLLEEHPAPEVAAAALYLARTAGGLGPRAAGTAAAAGGAAAAGSGGAVASAAGAPARGAAFVRLFISVGQRDDVNPGDLVGAITGEADVTGETVGRIDIRESHSTVEVVSTDADRIIQALNGRTLKGRSLRVDYDRKDRAAGATGGGPRAGSGGARGPKGGSGGRPRPGGSRPGGSRSGGSRPGGSRPGGRRPDGSGRGGS